MTRAVHLFLFVVPLHVAVAQSRPDVTEILGKISETYRAVSQCEFVTEVTESRGGAAGARSHSHIAFKAPDRYRMEGELPGLSSDLAALGETVIVYNGSTVWFYLPRTNQYSSIPGSALTADAPGDLGDLRPEAVDTFLTWRYRRAVEFAAGARLLRQETVNVVGGKVDCYVVSVTPERDGESYTWWVDAKRYRIVREDSAESSALFTTIKLDDPVPEDLFKFKPPAGATQLKPQ